MLYRNMSDQILFWVKPLGVIEVAPDQQDFWVITIAGQSIQTFLPLEGQPLTSPMDIKVPINYEKMKDILITIWIPLESDNPDYLIQQWINYSVTEPIPYDTSDIPDKAQPQREALPDKS